MRLQDVLSRLDGVRESGGGYTALCPSHADRSRSLSITDRAGRVLLHCFAGCRYRDIIAALRLHRGPRVAYVPVAGAAPGDDVARKSERARGIWSSTRPAAGTLAEAYLRSRGITVALPPSLRFHPGLRHPSGSTWPAMVALVSRGTDGAPVAVHRTYLAFDGLHKAPVETAKMMLGPCRCGCVRLADAGSGSALLIGEGIETCLSAMQAAGLPSWAALSTSGMRTLELPPGAKDVVVLADGDDPGEVAARACAYRWTREGRRVRIARPPRGQDFNDMLLREGANE